MRNYRGQYRKFKPRRLCPVLSSCHPGGRVSGNPGPRDGRDLVSDPHISGSRLSRRSAGMTRKEITRQDRRHLPMRAHDRTRGPVRVLPAPSISVSSVDASHSHGGIHVRGRYRSTRKSGPQPRFSHRTSRRETRPGRRPAGLAVFQARGAGPAPVSRMPPCRTMWCVHIPSSAGRDLLRRGGAGPPRAPARRAGPAPRPGPSSRREGSMGAVEGVGISFKGEEGLRRDTGGRVGRRVSPSASAVHHRASPHAGTFGWWTARWLVNPTRREARLMRREAPLLQ